MKRSRINGSLMLLLFLIISGCNQDEGKVSEALLEETTMMENIFAQLSTDLDDAITYTGISSGRSGIGLHHFGFGACATVTKDTPEDAEFPKVITIDYGTGCSSEYREVTKSGQVIVTLTGDLKEVGSKRIITFKDFKVNDNLIEGTKTITRIDEMSFSCTLEGGKITTAEGEEITRQSTRTRTLVAGGDTETREDDVFEITGSASGTTSEGTSYSKTIVNPLVVSRDCFWITTGTIKTTLGDAEVVIDFGQGNCDNIATRTENGVTEEITMDFRMKKHHRHHYKAG